MAKRRNENGQMRREEWEAEDDRDDGDAGEGGEGFQRASDDAIRKRKIVKARPSAPFGAKKTGLTSATAAAPAKSNPFAGFSGLTAVAPSKPDEPTSFSSSAPATASFSKGVATQPSTYQEAIEVLNNEFLDFATRQLRSNPRANWSASVQDYLKHADAIGVKFASTKPLPSARLATASSRAAPPLAKAADNPSLPETSEVSSAISFGAKTTSTALPQATATSGSVTPRAPQQKLTATSGFSFGVSSAPKTAELSKPTEISSFSQGNMPVTTTHGLSFNLLKPAATAAAPAVAVSGVAGGFSFGGGSSSSTAATASLAPTSPSTGFSFALTSSTPATKPFSFGGGTAFTAPTSSFVIPAPSTALSGGAAADAEDEENIGREEATVILKSDDPDDDCAFEVEKAKILEFKKDEKRWADKGTHPLKLLVNKASKIARILVRNEIGKIVLNASLYKGLSVKAFESKGKKVGVVLTLQVDTTMTQFLIKVSNERVDALISALEGATPTA